MATFLGIIGIILGGSLLFTIMEILVGVFCRGAIIELDPEKANFIADKEGDTPVSVFPGSISGLIRSENVPLLQRANNLLRSKLLFFGILFGFLQVLGTYLVLSFFSVTSSLLYWSLLFYPLLSFAKLGRKGISGDNPMMGEVQAFLNQIYLSAFTTSSFLTVIGIQVLRYFDVVF
jgi:hypothetical protein